MIRRRESIQTANGTRRHPLVQPHSGQQIYTRRTVLLTGLGATAMALVGCAALTKDEPATQPSANGTNQNNVISDLPPLPKKDHPAPNFTLATLDGDEINLADLRGKPVILNFWASWCGPCRLEMPHLQEVHAEQSEEILVIGVNLAQRENNMDDVPLFVDEFALTFPIVLDEEGDVAKLYEVRGQPASVFINAEGIVSMVFYGPVTKDFIEERITEIRNS